MAGPQHHGCGVRSGNPFPGPAGDMEKLRAPVSSTTGVTFLIQLEFRRVVQLTYVPRLVVVYDFPSSPRLLSSHIHSTLLNSTASISTMALFNGRVIAVTGAASGIGLATAHLLASRGASLSLADQNESALGAAERDIRAKYSSVEVLTYVVDVRKEESVKRWIEVTMEKFGRLDGAANLAGVIGMFSFFT
jgi:hypothetical protein